ncbi:hypothetical protein M0R04_14105 [Candidatus Dojkabacteria bacterium]|jgi:hypothetical protein|nr:hypothetical protein [Candidatus Dojkabacteria bacterium]
MIAINSMELTPNEKDIVNIMRELKPFEIVEIRKDSNGECDSYIVKREQKIHFIKLYQKKLST